MRERGTAALLTLSVDSRSYSLHTARGAGFPSLLKADFHFRLLCTLDSVWMQLCCVTKLGLLFQLLYTSSPRCFG